MSYVFSTASSMNYTGKKRGRRQIPLGDTKNNPELYTRKDETV